MKKLPEKRKPSSLARASQPYYWAMVFPGLLFTLVFEYGPMFGVLMAFQNFVPAKGITGSKWVGLAHFKSILAIPDIGEIVCNTLIISFGKIFGTMLVALAFAIMLNEIRLRTLKKWTQTIVYLPHFLSWVIMAGIVRNILGADGLLNTLLENLGMEPLNFFGSNDLFRFITGKRLRIYQMYRQFSGVRSLHIQTPYLRTIPQIFTFTATTFAPVTEATAATTDS